MLIAYRDYAKTATYDVPPNSGWLASAPLTNALDRRLAVKAIRAPTGGFHIEATVAPFASSGVEVGIISILNHNFTSSGTISLLVLDTLNNNIYTALLLPVWYPPENSQFPKNLHIVLPSNLSNVGTVDLTIAGPSLASTPGEVGRIWMGPYFSPTFGAAHPDFEIITRDESVVSRSVGQQTYVDYKPRYRQLHCSIPALSESEAIGIPAGTQKNLQDIAFEVGRGGEVIVIPSTANNQVIQKLGVYGHFMEPPSIRLTTTNKSGRLYNSTFDVVEDL